MEGVAVLAMLATARHYWRAGSDALAAYTMTAIVIGALLATAYVTQVAVEIDGVFERIMLLLVAGWFVALTMRLRRDALRSAADADQPVADLAA